MKTPVSLRQLLEEAPWARLSLVFAAAGFMTFASFLLMTLLISPDDETQSESVSVASSVRLFEFDPAKERPPMRSQPKKLLPMDLPPSPEADAIGLTGWQASTGDRVVFSSVADLVGPIDIQLKLSAPDMPFAPTLVVQPLYPLAAEINEIEGYVLVSFSIRPNGDVSNAIVVESEPDRIFDESALNAINRFRFAPSDQGEVRDDVQMKFLFEIASIYEAQVN